MAAKLVPITGAVLEWAVSESGLSDDEIADRVGVDSEDLWNWIQERSQPTRAQFTKLARALRRPSAIFFRPEPPKGASAVAEFRKARGKDPRSLGHAELRQVRRARRIQLLVSWVLREGDEKSTSIPGITPRSDPARAGRRIRDWLGVPVGEQLAWKSLKVAFDGWRKSLGDRGVLVFQLQLGKENIRGFSAYDEFAPLVAVNTAENYAARIFTIFHEVGHLVSRTDAACGQLSMRSKAEDLALERWCEATAAEALLPAATVRSTVEEINSSRRPPEDGFTLARRVAGRFNVSIRAAGMRLLGLGLASTGLYQEIERRARPLDWKKQGFGPGGGMPAPERRLGEVGGQTTKLLLSAMDASMLTERDLRDCLRLDGSELGLLRGAV